MTNAQRKEDRKLQREAHNAMRNWGEYHSIATGHTIEFNRLWDDMSVRCVQCDLLKNAEIIIGAPL